MSLSASEGSGAESYYSGLDTEPDTTDDVRVVPGLVGVANSEYFYSQEDLAPTSDSGGELQVVDRVSSWREAEETDTSDEEV